MEQKMPAFLWYAKNAKSILLDKGDQLNQSRLARYDLTNNAAWMSDKVIKKGNKQKKKTG